MVLNAAVTRKKLYDCEWCCKLPPCRPRLMAMLFGQCSLYLLPYHELMYVFMINCCWCQLLIIGKVWLRLKDLLLVEGVDLVDVSWILHVDVQILLVHAEQTPFRRGETPPRQRPASPARGRSPSSPPWRYRSPLRLALDYLLHIFSFNIVSNFEVNNTLSSLPRASTRRMRGSHVRKRFSCSKATVIIPFKLL